MNILWVLIVTAILVSVANSAPQKKRPSDVKKAQEDDEDGDEAAPSPGTRRQEKKGNKVEDDEDEDKSKSNSKSSTSGKMITAVKSPKVVSTNDDNNKNLKQGKGAGQLGRTLESSSKNNGPPIQGNSAAGSTTKPVELLLKGKGLAVQKQEDVKNAGGASRGVSSSSKQDSLKPSNSKHDGTNKVAPPPHSKTNKNEEEDEDDVEVEKDEVTTKTKSKDRTAKEDDDDEDEPSKDGDDDEEEKPKKPVAKKLKKPEVKGDKLKSLNKEDKSVQSDVEEIEVSKKVKGLTKKYKEETEENDSIKKKTKKEKYEDESTQKYKIKGEDGEKSKKIIKDSPAKSEKLGKDNKKNGAEVKPANGKSKGKSGDADDSNGDGDDDDDDEDGKVNNDRSISSDAKSKTVATGKTSKPATSGRRITTETEKSIPVATGKINVIAVGKSSQGAFGKTIIVVPIKNTPVATGKGISSISGKSKLLAGGKSRSMGFSDDHDDSPHDAHQQSAPNHLNSEATPENALSNGEPGHQPTDSAGSRSVGTEQVDASHIPGNGLGTKQAGSRPTGGADDAAAAPPAEPASPDGAKPGEKAEISTKKPATMEGQPESTAPPKAAPTQAPKGRAVDPASPDATMRSSNPEAVTAAPSAAETKAPNSPDKAPEALTAAPSTDETKVPNPPEKAPEAVTTAPPSSGILKGLLNGLFGSRSGGVDDFDKIAATVATEERNATSLTTGPEVNGGMEKVKTEISTKAPGGIYI